MEPLSFTGARLHLAVLFLTLVSALAEADVCHTDRPIVNADFEIKCSKFRYLQVEITCKSGQSWSTFPRERLNLQVVKTTIFRNCSFPRDLGLYNLTKSLGLGSIDTLEFEGLRAPIAREQLSGFTVATLDFHNNSLEELPSDLLYEVVFEELFLDGLELRAIPRGFFNRSRDLKILEVVNNRFTRLRRDDLAALVSLKDLLLFGNQIEEIEPGTFDNLVNLRVLDISKNRLKTLPTGIFKSLVKLERINMSENDFVDFPADLFRIENSRLQKVRLSHNRGSLTTLPNGFFKNLTILNYTELTSNNFSSLPEDLFFGTSSLMALNISNNRLETLPQKIFESTNLKELWMSENRLEFLPEGLFQYLYLEILYLNNNLLTNLSLGILDGLSTLKTLDVSHNNLKYIDHNACKHLKNVEYLDLSYNQLTLAHPHTEKFSVFVNCVHIVDMDISYNQISEIFQDWKFDGNLENLNLEGNNITYISVEDFELLFRKTKLNLRRNRISTIDLTGLEEAVKIYMKDNNEAKNAKVFLDHNPLNCDCNLLEFFRYVERKLNEQVYSNVRLYADDLECASPPELQNRSISTLKSEELKCLINSNVTEDACSENCTCWDFPGKRVLSVDCSYRNLSSVPALIVNAYNWSIDLNMTGNRLYTTPSLNRSYLLNVTAIDLSKNNISSVTLELFSPSLRELRLHDNKITRLDMKVLEYLADNSTLSNLTLHGNDWICDCEARNFLGVVQKKLTALELHEVTCRGSNRRISTITVNELCEGAVAIIVGASLLIAFFGIVLGLLAALYYRYQKEIKVWLYSKQSCLWFVTEDELDRDKQYDAFISYSHKDEEFVVKEIVAKLEEGPRPYKLCLHYRDWLAGEWIPAQIARSVDESRRTIVVLSPNFLESVWGRMEFRTAHSQALSEGRARVIVILYGDIGNAEDLDPELKTYLSMNTYVKWGDPWFWDKLRYALPHRCESLRRKTRTARIMENHLAQVPVGGLHEDNGKPETIPMPKIAPNTNDSAKLLDSGAEDEKLGASC